MAQTFPAKDFLSSPPKDPAPAVCVVFGDETFFKRHAIRLLRERVVGQEEADCSLERFSGPQAEWRDVAEGLFTLPMFGPSRRLVLVEEADGFVSRYRAELEQYVDRPCAKSVLVLEVKSWPGNTRLAKAVAAAGWTVDCNPLRPMQIPGWLGQWARQTYQVRLDPDAAQLLVDWVGTELGLLDQELQKLALAVAPEGRVLPEHVEQYSASWRTKTIWEVLDAALAGNLAESLTYLDRLLLAGETPVGLFAQLSAALRRFAAATRKILDAEAAGQRLSLREALRQAGVPVYFLEKAEGQLRRLGRVRGGQLYQQLLEADLALKGASALPPRLVLETLLVRLAAPQEPRSASSASPPVLPGRRT
ncbi:MAG TPA: DNA polymerase III subunit delta [Thermoguttaceae bacterium]|nr:DNA polymerase III subunit delta [Thermoguttaceae bacterium]HPP52171.1 DNA polymerase III subunit delta [Thermoguttaceae bacterium]